MVSKTIPSPTVLLEDISCGADGELIGPEGQDLNDKYYRLKIFYRDNLITGADGEYIIAS